MLPATETRLLTPHNITETAAWCGATPTPTGGLQVTTTPGTPTAHPRDNNTPTPPGAFYVTPADQHTATLGHHLNTARKALHDAQEALQLALQQLPTNHNGTARPRPGETWVAITHDPTTRTPTGLTTLTNHGHHWTPHPAPPHAQPISSSHVTPLHKISN